MQENGTSVPPGPDDLEEPWRALRMSRGEQRGCGYLLLHDASTDRSQSEMTYNHPPGLAGAAIRPVLAGLTHSELTAALSTILVGSDASMAGE